jgi:endonuclease/exonuclease/phosphatase family metal-dependent hydrolase
LRRIALGAVGPVLALALAIIPTVPAHSSSRLSLDSAGGSVGTTHVTVTWNWDRKATKYRIQVAKDSTFASTVSTRAPRSDSNRPPGGRQAAVIGHLKDASYYWVRIQKFDKQGKSSWSAPTKVATKASWPDPITNVTNTPGPLPGETTISWSSSGAKTNFFRLETALTPFSQTNPGASAKGWNPHVFKIDGSQRSITLTAEQTAQAGAPLGSGRHLLFRLYAVRKGPAAKQIRGYAHIQAATVAGEASTMTGTPIRAASYNVRLAALDAGTANSWADRAPRIAQNIAAQQPTIMALQELMPSMWNNQSGGLGLGGALQAAGLGRYKLLRDTPYSSTTPGDARILYDGSKLQLVSNCDPTKPTCGIVIPDVDHQSVAEVAEFRDLASGERFWFVSTHLAHGNTADVDALRATEAQTIVAGINQLNTEGLPVILGGDMNSYQTCPGRNAPHTVLLNDGYYDTSAAATQVNLQYNSYNGFASPEVPSNNGFGARLDAIMTSGMPGADRFEIVRTGAPYPSDHNMVIADLKLPAA